MNNSGYKPHYTNLVSQRSLKEQSSTYPYAGTTTISTIEQQRVTVGASGGLYGQDTINESIASEAQSSDVLNNVVADIIPEDSYRYGQPPQLSNEKQRVNKMGRFRLNESYTNMQQHGYQDLDQYLSSLPSQRVQ